MSVQHCVSNLLVVKITNVVPNAYQRHQVKADDGSRSNVTVHILQGAARCSQDAVISCVDLNMVHLHTKQGW